MPRAVWHLSDVNNPSGVIDFNLSNHVLYSQKVLLPSHVPSTLKGKVFKVGKGKRDIHVADIVHISTLHNNK